MTYNYYFLLYALDWPHAKFEVLQYESHRRTGYTHSCRIRATDTITSQIISEKIREAMIRLKYHLDIANEFQRSTLNNTIYSSSYN